MDILNTYVERSWAITIFVSKITQIFANFQKLWSELWIVKCLSG